MLWYSILNPTNPAVLCIAFVFPPVPKYTDFILRSASNFAPIRKRHKPVPSAEVRLSYQYTVGGYLLCNRV